MNELAPKQTTALVSTKNADLIQAGVTDNTLRAYRRGINQLEIWLDGRTLDDALFAEYVTKLHHEGKSPATISQAAAAVKWYAKHQDIDVVGPITNATLAGIRREGRGRGRGQVDGMDWTAVERVCAFAEAEKTIAGLRDSAMIRLMSDCLLRISEAVAVDVQDFQKNTLSIEVSKTDQEGRGEALYVGDATMRAIKQYKKRADISEGALFCRVLRGDHPTPQRLTATGAREIIKARATAAGVEGFISGHSLRVGSAVSLAQAGASVVDMQTAGRWRSSEMPAHYAKAELAERGAIARFKYGKSGGRRAPKRK